MRVMLAVLAVLVAAALAGCWLSLDYDFRTGRTEWVIHDYNGRDRVPLRELGVSYQDAYPPPGATLEAEEEMVFECVDPKTGLTRPECQLTVVPLPPYPPPDRDWPALR